MLLKFELCFKRLNVYVHWFINFIVNCQAFLPLHFQLHFSWRLTHLTIPLHCTAALDESRSQISTSLQTRNSKLWRLCCTASTPLAIWKCHLHWFLKWVHRKLEREHIRTGYNTYSQGNLQRSFGTHLLSLALFLSWVAIWTLQKIAAAKWIWQTHEIMKQESRELALQIEQHRFQHSIACTGLLRYCNLLVWWSRYLKWWLQKSERWSLGSCSTNQQSPGQRAGRSSCSRVASIEFL